MTAQTQRQSSPPLMVKWNETPGESGYVISSEGPALAVNTP
jgi:hypothetical protein